MNSVINNLKFNIVFRRTDVLVFNSQIINSSPMEFHVRSGLEDIRRPRSHDAGTKLCRHKMNTVCNCSHDARSMCVSSLLFSYLNLTLIIVGNIYHSQNVSSNRNETLMVTCSHSAETVEFCCGFKLLRLVFRFQTLTVSIPVSNSYG